MQQKRTFVSLHEEFGIKILKDQRARWSGESQHQQQFPIASALKESSSSLQIQPPSLSVLQQDALNF
jgi:hypothetical protein